MGEADVHYVKLKTRIAVVMSILAILLVLANFSYAFLYPHQKTATIIGPIGPSGQNGPKGADGAQGVMGLNGTNGKDGAIGPQGPAGPAGSSGATGAQGLQGVSGLNGLNGKDGAIGLQGIQGVQGVPGIPGTNGINGKQIELQGDNTAKAIEWRYVGDTTWQVLVKYCDLTNTCVPVVAAD